MNQNPTFKRVFLFSLSGLGAGAMPDAKLYHCSNANTLRSLFQTGKLRIPQLQRLGIGQINGLSFLGGNNYSSSFLSKNAQRSENKDQYTCLQEMLGVVSAKRYPVYPYGLPSSVLLEIEKTVHRQFIGNVQCSKLNALMDYGMTHLDTGKPILFASYDSSVSIAAHTSQMSVNELNDMGADVRKILCGQHAVGRVTTIPFNGKWPYFTSVQGGKTFLNDNQEVNLLNVLTEQHYNVYSFGCYSLIDRSFRYQNKSYPNEQIQQMISQTIPEDFHGLCFATFTEFESSFGALHDAEGMTQSLNRFDEWLVDFIPQLKEDDLLILSSDGGCDPNFTLSNERTREYVPVIAYGKKTYQRNLGVRIGLCDIAATTADALNANYPLSGNSILIQ